MLTYLNKTDSKEARYLSVDIKGAVSPGITTDDIGKLELNTAQLSLTGTLNIDIADANRYDSLQLSGEGDTGKLTLNAGSVCNISPVKDVVLHGTYRVITAKSVTGKFDKLTFKGTNEVKYSVNYLPDGVEVVFP